MRHPRAGGWLAAGVRAGRDHPDEDGADLRVPADLPRGISEKVRDASQRAFRTLGCEGMARVDFFLRNGSELVVNELNTIPGFTNISMYPKMLEATGIPYPELVDRLLRHAIERFRRRP
jgi:D-alanine-D-alanine ligase